MINVLLIVVAAFLVLNALLTVGAVGKPRLPIAPRQAVMVVVFDGAIIAILIAAILNR